MLVNTANEAIEIAKKTLVIAGHNIYWITDAKRTDGDWKVIARTLAVDRVIITIDANNGQVMELVRER
jgi:hypothetical protein